MTPEEKRIVKNAKALAKRKDHIRETVQRLIGKQDFSQISRPAAIFMAGSPGAGKTEIAKELISKFDPKPVRIDADDFRQGMEGYDGNNSHLFQEAATTMVQKVLDRIYELEKKGPAVPFILDGTFSYARTIDNLNRALKHGYAIDIYYVYQRPELAWAFTKARELAEGRVVPEDTFINAFLQARANIVEAKRRFGDRVQVSLIIKDTDARNSQTYAYISEADLEELLPNNYNEAELRRILNHD